MRRGFIFERIKSEDRGKKRFLLEVDENRGPRKHWRA
jgi:hypothetical protein